MNIKILNPDRGLITHGIPNEIENGACDSTSALVTLQFRYAIPAFDVYDFNDNY